MANTVTIRTTAPGAKEAAGDVGKLRDAFGQLGVKGSIAGLAAERVGTQAKGMGINMTQAAVGIGLAAGAVGAISSASQAAGQFLGNAALAAMDEEANIKKLDTALRDNVAGWDGNTSAIESQIKTRENLAFSDDELRDSLGRLVTTTHNVQAAFDGQTLAMDMARAKGIDLSEATDRVSRVMSGNYTRALREAGISLDGIKNKQDALAALQKAYAGQAVAYAETTKATFESLNIELQDIQEEIGSHALPTMDKLAHVMKDDVAPAASNAADALGVLLDVATDEMTMQEGAAFWDMIPSSIRNIIPGAQQATSDLAEAINTQVVSDFSRSERSENAAHDLAVRMTNEFTGGLNLDVAMEDAMAGTVDAIAKSKTEAVDAMSDLTYAIAHPLEGLALLAQIQGELASQELANGLASGWPWVRAQAEDTRDRLVAQWEKITGIAYDAGYDAQTAYALGFKRAPEAKVHVGNVPGGLDPEHRFSGGGRASGGPVAGNGIYEVNEQGEPEVLRAGGKNYLLMGRNRGDVEPLKPATGYAPSPGMPARIEVHVSLNNREFAQHQKHYAVVQSGGPAFR